MAACGPRRVCAGCAGEAHALARSEDVLHEFIARGGHPLGVPSETTNCLFERSGHAGDARKVLGARALAPLLRASGDERRYGKAIAQVQGTHASRSVELVGRERERVDAKLANVDGDVAHRLHGVRVKGSAMAMRHSGKLSMGSMRAHLVVRQHDRHERRCGRVGGGAVVLAVSTACDFAVTRFSRGAGGGPAEAACSPPPFALVATGLQAALSSAASMRSRARSASVQLETRPARAACSFCDWCKAVASRPSTRTKPCSSTGRYVTATPLRSRASQQCRMAWCSMELVMMRGVASLPYRSRNRWTAPRSTQLSDSLPPLVKTPRLPGRLPAARLCERGRLQAPRPPDAPRGEYRSGCRTCPSKTASWPRAPRVKAA